MSHAKAQSLQQHYTRALAPRYGTLEHVKGRAMWRCGDVTVGVAHVVVLEGILCTKSSITSYYAPES